MQKCGPPNASKTTKSARAVLPIPTMVCSSCVGPNDVFSSFVIWLPLFGIFNVLTQMLGHVTVDRGCTNTVRESALKGFWEKNPLPHQRTELNLRQYYPWLISLRLCHCTNWAVPLLGGFQHSRSSECHSQYLSASIIYSSFCTDFKPIKF